MIDETESVAFPSPSSDNDPCPTCGQKTLEGFGGVNCDGFADFGSGGGFHCRACGWHHEERNP